jgi:ribosome maturation protein SDO1
VVNYRQGVETDLSEVLQTDRVFVNVSKGEFANSSDLQKAFDTTDQDEICRIILMKGSLQVSDMERSAHLESTLREIAAMVGEKCVNPQSNRPYTVDTIRDAMKEAEYNVSLTRNVKQQFLDCVKLIRQKKVLSLERAKMRLCATIPQSQADTVKGSLEKAGIQIVSATSTANDMEQIQFLMDPSLYREVDAIVKNCQRGNSDNRLEILEQAVFEYGDVGLQSEVDRIDKFAADQQQWQQSQQQQSRQVDTASIDLEEVDKVIHKLDEIHVAKENDDNATDYYENEREDNNMDMMASHNSKKQQQKQKQKKSKKAKRREKEEASERQKRVDHEKERQEQRESRLQQQESTSGASGNKETPASADDVPVNKTKSCNTCGGSFTDTEYRAHFRSDWHRYNLKLKLQSVPAISQEEFQLCDAESFFE